MMSISNNFVFKALQIIAWVIFVGLCIEAGGLIINFLFSVFKPEYLGNLYQKLDLSSVYQQNKWIFFGMYSFVITISVLKAHLFYIVITLLRKLDLSNPFSSYVANKINSIAYYTFSIGVISHIAKEVTKNMQHHAYEIDKLNDFWVDSQAFILMAAIVYIIATIFKRGIELQNENELTI
ncbi:MAG: DUF2975 domain-containing protein [Flavobacteriaceae bacterium]